MVLVVVSFSSMAVRHLYSKGVFNLTFMDISMAQPVLVVGGVSKF